MSPKKIMTSDGLEILYHCFIAGHPDRIAALEEAKVEVEIAEMVYNLRESAGLTQKELAKLVGTTASVICRLEDADYEGHSLSMLRRIAAALDHRVELRFVPLKSSAVKKKKATHKKESNLSAKSVLG